MQIREHEGNSWTGIRVRITKSIVSEKLRDDDFSQKISPTAATACVIGRLITAPPLNYVNGCEHMRSSSADKRGEH